MVIEVAASVRLAHDRQCRTDKGASALEFALVLPVLMAIVLGIIQFGLVMQAQLALVHASEEGARVASIGSQGQKAGSLFAKTAFDAWNVDWAEARATPLTKPDLTVSLDNSNADYVSVTASYPYNGPYLPRFWNLLLPAGAGPPAELSSTTTMRRE
jgi:Flp pilus assembly protein TadG